MIIKFQNLGIIKETELDLRPLTVIVGPNNSNKTYIAYSVYGLLRQVGDPYYDVESTMFDAINGVWVRRIDKEYLDYLVAQCQIRVPSFVEDLPEFYQDTTLKLFADTRLFLDISHEEVRSALSRIGQQRKLTLLQTAYNVLLSGDAIEIRQMRPDDPPGINAFGASRAVAHDIMQQIFPYPYLLPAERNAFVITYKVLANRRYKLLREGQRRLVTSGSSAQQRQVELLKEQDDIRYPQPIEDFLDFLTDIELENPRFASVANGRRTTRDDSKSKFAELAALVEQAIQGGNKTEFKPTKFGGKEIKIRISKELEIDLYNASSSIKQLAPLLLYLRYRAKENDLLIIDEPEMNLHPEAQAKMLEILAMLVNAGVKVLLTTHSPYFMAHLNNLVQDVSESPTIRKRQAGALYLKDPRAFLSMEQVSAYEMKEDETKHYQLVSLKDEDYGIRYDTLSDVSVDLQAKFFEIHERGKPGRRGQTK